MTKAVRASDWHKDIGGARLEFAVGRDLVVAMHVIGQGVEGLQKIASALVGTEIGADGGGDVGNLEVGLVGIAGAERLVTAAEPGTLAELPGERRIARNGNIRRQRPTETELVRHDGADGGIIAERRTEAARHHPVGRGLVMIVVVRPERTNATLSITRAMRGNRFPICVPGTLVAMGR